MSPEKYKTAFLKAGGNLLLRDDKWLATHRAAGRKPAETAALTRIVLTYQFDAFCAAFKRQVMQAMQAQRRPPRPAAPEPTLFAEVTP